MKVSWLKFLNLMLDIKERNMRGFLRIESPLFLYIIQKAKSIKILSLSN